MRNGSGRRRRAAGVAAAGLAPLVAALVPVGGAVAQESVMPRFPYGTPVVVVPAQSVAATSPAAAVAAAGGGVSGEELLRTLDAELAFALGERRGAGSWALPEAVVRRAERNPTLRLDPRHLAYQGLLVEPDRRDQLYEPLHGELRVLAALFDTRYVVLPVRLRLERDTASAGAAGGPGGPDGEGDGEGDGKADGETPWRARLLLALIDIRRSAVLWHGEVAGDPAPAGSPALLASLAARVARQVAPS
ncbi:MAG: hypothetical protein RRA92_03570 [Gemmatimonadota bacterium]|nr:hypothetical protein [Gemmatimonadota bacterium]